jgi:hypothetical protein
MIFAIDEDDTLCIFADVDNANVEIEGYDVESGAVPFFDAQGDRLKPSFPRRNERRILGLRVDVDPGPFALDEGDATAMPLAAEFHRVRHVQSNP